MILWNWWSSRSSKPDKFDVENISDVRLDEENTNGVSNGKENCINETCDEDMGTKEPLASSEAPSTHACENNTNKHVDNSMSSIPNQRQSAAEIRNCALLRLFESSVCTIHMALSYIYQSKEAGVQTYVVNKLFDYPSEEVDFYLPQFVCLYVFVNELSAVLKSYFQFRCRKCSDFSVRLIWLLESLMPSSQSHAARFVKDIRNEVYRQNRSAFIQKNKVLSARRSHQRALSETTLLYNGSMKRFPSQPLKLSIGHLNSGKAFDNGCRCAELATEDSVALVCKCEAPRLATELEFMKALVSIGKKLSQLQNKELRNQSLISELKAINLNLPARVWIPLVDQPHHVVRIAYTHSTVLNSKDKAPFIVFVEIVTCADVFFSPLPAKQCDSTLTVLGFTNMTLSTESLTNRVNSDDGDEDVWSIGLSNGTKSLQLDTVSMDSCTSSESHDFSVAEVRRRLCDTCSIRSGSLFERDPSDPSAAALKEPWETKVDRLRNNSPYGHFDGWQLVGCIVKCGDDLRQELLAFQFMQRLKEILFVERVSVYLRPIKVMVLGNDCGLIEPVLNTVSLHQIKKHSKLSLFDYFVSEFGDITSEGFLEAQKNFVQSAAGYSVLCYLLQVKDRHNGNILLDNQGHIIHIDFAYMLSFSPRNLGFESSPFKITQDFVEVMGGIESDMFKYYKILILQSLIAARKHMDTLVPIVEIMQLGGQLRCFQKGAAASISKLRERFHTGMTDDQMHTHVERMVTNSLHSLTTKIYDNFQYYTNGIN